MPWSRPLARPFRSRIGAVPRMLDDARTYLLELADTEAERPAWQSAAGLLVAAAESGTAEAIAAATDQIERAMLLSYRLDLSR